MWTSLCNFLCNKLFHRRDLEIRRSDDSCGVYGKRLKLIDRIWDSNGLLNRTKSSCSLSMQRENFDISDDEGDNRLAGLSEAFEYCIQTFKKPVCGLNDCCRMLQETFRHNDEIKNEMINVPASLTSKCCIIAEIPRRKKPVNSTPVSTTETTSTPHESSKLCQTWSSFSFRNDSLENNTEKKDNAEVKVINKLGKDENVKLQPRRIFSTQRALSQGKLVSSKMTNRNQWRKKLNFLQESYRLNEKLQYIELLRTHTSSLLTGRKPLKTVEPPKREIEVIDLSDDEPTVVTKKAPEKDKIEEQDVQIVGEVSGVRSFQDILKRRPLNVELALKSISSNRYQKNSEILQLPDAIINLVDDDIIYSSQKTDALEEKLRDFMQITSPVAHEVENREPYYLPELTSEQEKKIRNALIPEPGEQVLSAGFGLQITRQDMQTLVGLNWLNDEVINFYMNLIMERSKLLKEFPKVYAFNTFFYPKLVSGGHHSLRRWTKQVDIFSFDIILVPVHLGMHWCLSVIDFRTKSVKYYDSIGSPNHQCLEVLLLYLKAESLDKRKKILTTIGWEKSNVKNIPQQMNGSDCGVFSCMFAEYLTRDSIISFTQDDMPYFRKKMVIEILEKKLLT